MYTRYRSADDGAVVKYIRVLEGWTKPKQQSGKGEKKQVLRLYCPLYRLAMCSLHAACHLIAQLRSCLLYRGTLCSLLSICCTYRCNNTPVSTQGVGCREPWVTLRPSCYGITTTNFSFSRVKWAQ